MKKICWILLILAFLIGVFSGRSHAGKDRTIEKICTELNIAIENGTVITKEDTHGGFHGDGTTLIAIQLPDDTLKDTIKAADSWNSFPLDETTEALLYGHVSNDTITGPYLTDEDGDPLLPEITEGFYRLYDRHTDTDLDILHRYSFNFTIAVFDSDSNILYYCKLDT